MRNLQTQAFHVVLGSLLATSAAACDRDEEERPGAAQIPASTTVERIEEEPREFVGQRVTVTGEADTVFSERAFELEGDDWWFDEEVLVVTRAPVRMAGGTVTDDDDLVVSGTVRMFTVAEIEQEVGWDLTPELATTFRNQPVIVADSVRRITEAARWTEKEPEGATVSVVTIYSMPTPEQLAGTNIELSGVPIRTKSQNGAWVGESHFAQIFVEAPDPSLLQQLNVGDRIDVRGTLQKMPPPKEAVSKLGLDPNLHGQIAEEPLYVDATSIRSVPEPAPAQPGAGTQ